MLLAIACPAGAAELTAAPEGEAADQGMGPATDIDAATGWPRRMACEDRIITIFQPQPERLDGTTLTARAALSVTEPGGGTVYGAEWFTAQLEIDHGNRIATVSSMTITRIRFPAGEAGDQATAVMEGQLRRTLTPENMTFDLDHLIATLEQAPTPTTAYRVAPPHILIRTAPCELLLIDGEPMLQLGHRIRRVVNTPAFVCVDLSDRWWFRTQGGWLSAPGLYGRWTAISAPPAVIDVADAAGVPPPESAASSGVAPEVIVAREPTELIAFTGEPHWTAIAATGILAADNCASDVFTDELTRHYWLLLSGRWYSSERLADEATWTYCLPSALPAGFAAIPEDSPWARIRAHIRGTDEAREAILDAVIPQTARIPRSASITVTYDGDPHFVGIPGSDLRWADNSVFAVFQSDDDRFWCCNHGVWYVAPGPLGPWTVATALPGALHEIPPENPDHDASFVDIYGSTDEDVVSGYTAGYLDEFTGDGTPIYGTGWTTPGYYGADYWCPRPLTWGQCRTFDPRHGDWGIGRSVWGRRGIDLLIGIEDHHHRDGRGTWWGPIDHPPIEILRTGMRLASSDALPGWSDPAATFALRDQDAATAWLPEAVYHRVAGARMPSRERVPRMEAQIVHGQVEQIFVDANGSLFRRDATGSWQERRERGWAAIAWAHGPSATPRPTPRDQIGPDRHLDAGDRGPVHRPHPAEAPAGTVAVSAQVPTARGIEGTEQEPDSGFSPPRASIQSPMVHEAPSAPAVAMVHMTAGFAQEPSHSFQQLERFYQQRTHGSLRSHAVMRSAPAHPGMSHGETR
jgi:hypothetical protein